MVFLSVLLADLETKCVFKHQDFQIFGLKLNKYNIFTYLKLWIAVATKRKYLVYTEHVLIFEHTEEVLVCELKSDNFKIILIVSVYRPPPGNVEQFV